MNATIRSSTIASTLAAIAIAFAGSTADAQVSTRVRPSQSRPMEFGLPQTTATALIIGYVYEPDPGAPAARRPLAGAIIDSVLFPGEEGEPALPVPAAVTDANGYFEYETIRFTGTETFPPRFRNTCWSTVAPDDAMKIGAAYEASEDKIAKVEGFISEVGESREIRAQTRAEADAWYDSITQDIFG